MNPLEQEEEEAKKEGRRGKEKEKTEEEEQEEIAEEEEDKEEEEAATSAELDQCGAQVMELPITSRESELGGRLKKLVKFLDNLNDRLRQSERPSKEILAEVEREIQEQLEKVKVLIGAGAGKGLEELPNTGDLQIFIVSFISIRNERVQKIRQGIQDVLINEDSAQQMLDQMCDHVKFMSHLNYLAFRNILKWCNYKGVWPTTDKIEALLTSETFSTSEALFAFLQLMEQLIKAHRNHGNSDSIRIYLNPMQDIYEVSEELRLAAGRVIRAAYGTLSNCLESGSLINTLLFLNSGMIDDDEAVIKEWFEKAEFPLHRDMKYSLFMIAQMRKERLNQQEKMEDELSRRNDNWLQRSVLHLVAIFVHNDQVLNLIPKELIEKAKDGRDLHGCTPLHTAYLHGNKSVILLLESYDAKFNSIADYFRKTPESFRVPCEYNEDNHTEYCRKIATTKSSVFATMKKMLILPINQCEAIEENFKVLFEMMVSQDGLLNATVKIAGSVREKLKVGRFNEVDVQIRMESNPFDSGPFPRFHLHEHLVKKMAGIDWSLISLRPVSVVFDAPWKFILEREGSYNGLVISVDVVPIVKDLSQDGPLIEERMNLNLVLKNAPHHQSLKILKKDSEFCFSSISTCCEHEWDILDNLPPGCRLGILIAKALLEVLDQVSDYDHAFTKAPITSYVIKNTVFWILAGKTPQGNVIGERYGHLKQQFNFKGTIPTWTTEEDLERHGEEGRFWAETIFDAIHFMARNCGLILGSFLENDANHVFPDQLYDVLDTCERCLERLRPCVFFDE